MDIIENEYGVCINNPDKFVTVSNFEYANGVDVAENIKIFKKTVDFKLDIAQISDYDDFFVKEYGDVVIITFLNNDVVIEDFTKDLKVANSPKGFIDARIDLSHVIYIKKKLSLGDLIKIYKKVSAVKSKFLAGLKLPLHIDNILNTNDFLAVAANDCNGGEYDDIDLNELNIEDAVEITLEDSFEKLELTFGILDYFVAEGILIGDLVEAGINLLDDVEATDELKQKVEAQILKSLTDVNVIALLMAAIRTEQDLKKNNIREISLQDDSALFCTDEVLGLAVSNQIAGTRAALNFKHYKGAKPGIIYGLPPMLDDVFAGLIAGCTSKVFEEYHDFLSRG